MRLVFETRSDFEELQRYGDELCADGIDVTVIIGDNGLSLTASMPTDEHDVRKMTVKTISWLELGNVRNRLSLLKCDLDRVVQEVRNIPQLAVHI